MDNAYISKIESLNAFRERATAQPSYPSNAHKPAHARSGSLTKRPMSPLSRDTSDAFITKKLCTFRAEPGTGVIGSEPSSSFPTVLPVCAVCLGRQKHSMPVIRCPAKQTWDDQFDTLCERVNKVLRLRDGGKLLCSQWQRDEGCQEKHDHMHACSGCEALTHGASKCPRAQRAPPANAV